MTHPDDILTPDDLVQRDRIIEEGIAQCRRLLARATKPQDRMYCLGAIHGFEACRAFTEFGHFTGRCEELQWSERHERYKGLDGDLRAYYMIDVNDRPNENKQWFLNGEREQIRHAYDQLMVSRRGERGWNPPIAYTSGLLELLLEQ